MKIVIIGGGASGLVAAIEAARAGAKVTILEHTNKLGKKILSTGNGKCNYTNANIQAKYLHLDEDDLAYFVVKKIGYDGVNRFFEGLGIEAFVRDGYTYPKSEQAASVRDALLLEVQRLGIEVMLCAKTLEIVKSKQGFMVCGETTPDADSKELGLRDSNGSKKKKNRDPHKKDANTLHPAHTWQRSFDKIILATGSKAFSASGSDGSGVHLLSPFQIKMQPFLPALCALYTKENAFFKAAGGVRVKSRVHLHVNDETMDWEDGELQITDYGLSGIPIFQLSRHASMALHAGKKVEISVNILPEAKDMWTYLKARRDRTHLHLARDFGLGMVNQKLWSAILNRANISETLDLHADANLRTLEKALCNLRFEITHSADTEKSQICTGGIDLGEMDFTTMELKKVRGMYAIGELVDIDGICGGYNLTWAWCSGMFAARKAVEND